MVGDVEAHAVLRETHNADSQSSAHKFAQVALIAAMACAVVFLVSAISLHFAHPLPTSLAELRAPALLQYAGQVLAAPMAMLIVSVVGIDYSGRRRRDRSGAAQGG